MRSLVRVAFIDTGGDTAMRPPCASLEYAPGAMRSRVPLDRTLFPFLAAVGCAPSSAKRKFGKSGKRGKACS
jgi:hypothetical protein